MCKYPKDCAIIFLGYSIYNKIIKLEPKKNKEVELEKVLQKVKKFKN